MNDEKIFLQIYQKFSKLFPGVDKVIGKEFVMSDETMSIRYYYSVEGIAFYECNNLIELCGHVSDLISEYDKDYALSDKIRNRCWGKLYGDN